MTLIQSYLIASIAERTSIAVDILTELLEATDNVERSIELLIGALPKVELEPFIPSTEDQRNLTLIDVNRIKDNVRYKYNPTTTKYLVEDKYVDQDTFYNHYKKAGGDMTYTDFRNQFPTKVEMMDRIRENTVTIETWQKLFSNYASTLG